MNHPVPDDDVERVARLELMGFLDPLPADGLHDITELCRAVFGTPINLINIVGADSVWMRCADGVEQQTVDRASSVCSWTILGDGILEIPDTALDDRFAAMPSLSALGIRYYAGVPLEVDGVRVGTLCIHDREPRAPMSPSGRAILESFGRIAARQLLLEQAVRTAIRPDSPEQLVPGSQAWLGE